MPTLAIEAVSDARPEEELPRIPLGVLPCRPPLDSSHSHGRTGTARLFRASPVLQEELHTDLPRAARREGVRADCGDSESGSQRISQRARGFFGFFECVDDQEVANGLLDAARGWLAEQDIHCVRGPANPGVNYVLGTLVEGFNSPPTFMMAYNPPYYGRLIEGYGFRKAQDLYAYGGDVSLLPAIARKLNPVADQIVERLNIRVRSLSKKRFNQDVRDFLAIYNQSMVNHWGFSPMAEEELNEMVKVLRFLVLPELVVAAEIDDRLVGMILVLPDYNPADQADRRAAFSFRLPAFDLAAAEDQEDPHFGGQRPAGIPSHGRIPRAAASHGPPSAEIRHSGGGVLVGGGIEFSFSR